MIDYAILRRLIEIEYSEIVEFSSELQDKLRIYLRDGSVADIWFSKKIEGRYSFHWERRGDNPKIFRHDNIPHPRWKGVATFPKHFHNGLQDRVVESNISEDLITATRQFMDFIKKQMK